MDEDDLPILHIRRAKKNHLPEQDDDLPSITIQPKRKSSNKDATSGSSIEDEESYEVEPPAFVSPPASPVYTSAYQKPERYQPAQGQSRLGKDIQTGQYVDVPQFARRQGLYITGIQGTGKSVLIENLIIQDIKQNMGVCLLDPHGDLTQAVLSRLPDRREKDVIYLDMNNYRYPFGVNIFNCPDLTNLVEVQKTIDQVIHVFEKLLGVSHETPLILEYLQNCTHTIIANPGYTMADIPLLLQDGACRKKLVAHVTDSDVQLFWRLHEQKKPADQSYDISSTLRRVRQFLQPLSRPIVGQSASTIDIRQVMDEGKILLVKLDTTLESITSLIGSLIVALFLNAAKSRADLPVQKRRQFNLYADEFQRFATEDFATLLEEARKFGIGITIAHQNGSQLETSLKERARSVANLAVFKVNSKDADELASEFDITPQEAWEEELEEEWVEIIKPQRHERIEEQVEVEVEEDIEEVAQNPIEYLTSARGTHRNSKVRDAIRILLDNYSDKSNHLSSAFDKLLVELMEGREMPGTDTLVEKVHRIAKSIVFSPWFNFHRDVPNEYALCDEKLLRFTEAIIKNGQADDNIINDLYESAFEAYFAWDIYERNHKDWMREEDMLSEDDVAFLRKGFFREENALLVVCKKNIKELRVILPAIKSLCEGLAADPIRVPTGKKQMVKRIQPHLTYLTHESEKITHPRVAIMHPQRTYADMHNEIASELTNLPVFNAQVKIATDNGTEEHTIKTLDPKQDHERPLFGQALQDRIDSIKKQNIQDGYVRERTSVEEEGRK